MPLEPSVPGIVVGPTLDPLSADALPEDDPPVVTASSELGHPASNPTKTRR
jgi:hypothetical protein